MEVNQAMEAANGDRDAASLALGMEPNNLKAFLHEYPELHRWTVDRLETKGKTTPPAQNSTYSRECAIPPEKRPEINVLELSSAIAKELTLAQYRFRLGFPTMGFSPSEIDFAASLSKWMGEQNLEISAMVSGGVAHTSLRVMMQIQALSTRLANGFEGDNAIIEESMCWNAFNRLCENLVRMADCSQNGNLIRARIAQIKKETQQNAKAPKHSRANWGPPLQAQQTSVHVTGDKVSVAVTDSKAVATTDQAPG